MSSPKPERSEGHVRDIVQSGEGVVATSTGLLLVRGVLPDERVLVERHPRERKGRAKLVKLLDPSSARVEAPCTYAVRCGGCGLMHAAAPLQASLRTHFLEQALARAGVLGDLRVVYHAAEAQLAYRTRARLAFEVRGQERTLGFHREGRADLVDIAHCIVLVPVLDAALAELRGRVLPLLSGEGELRLYLGQLGGAVAVLHAKLAQAPAVYSALDGLVAQGFLTGAALYAATATMPASFGDTGQVATAADGDPLFGPIGGFSQANAEVNARLVAHVRECAASEGARVLELYAGHGNFTVALAAGAASYTAVEREASAIASLRENLARRGLKVKALVGDAAQHKQREPVDVVVLDPPRTGERGLLTALARLKPRRIVYVSCDPATLARDLSEVCGKGYRLASAHAFDMFPQTAELESVATLVRV